MNGNAQDNVKGKTTAFATLTRFRGHRDQLLEALVLFVARTRRGDEPTMRELNFLHHALWARLPGARLKPKGARLSRNEKRGMLLFTSYFTGDLADYLGGFTSKLPGPMDKIWFRCEDWPGAKAYGECLQFIRKYRLPSSAYYNGRANLGVKETRVALRTRLRLDELAAQSATGSDAEFQHAYEAGVRSAWGDDNTPLEPLS